MSSSGSSAAKGMASAMFLVIGDAVMMKAEHHHARGRMRQAANAHAGWIAPSALRHPMTRAEGGQTIVTVVTIRLIISQNVSI